MASIMCTGQRQNSVEFAAHYQKLAVHCLLKFPVRVDRPLQTLLQLSGADRFACDPASLLRANTTAIRRSLGDTSLVINAITVNDTANSGMRYRRPRG